MDDLVDSDIQEAKTQDQDFLERSGAYFGYLMLMFGDRVRRDRLRQALAVHAHAIIDVTKFVIPLAILALGWHYILPEWSRWLTDDQIRNLERFLIGGAGVGVVSTIFVFVLRYVR